MKERKTYTLNHVLFLLAVHHRQWQHVDMRHFNFLDNKGCLGSRTFRQDRSISNIDLSKHGELVLAVYKPEIEALMRLAALGLPER